MPRNIELPLPNRGLNLVRSPSKVSPGQGHKLENVDLRSGVVTRRRGSRAAYETATSADNNSVELLHRYYKRNTTGTIITRLVMHATGADDGLYFYDGTDWDDDTATIKVAANWRELVPSSSADGTLYDFYGATGNAITVNTSSYLGGLTAKNWFYTWPNTVTSDNNEDDQNVPLRTQCETGQQFTFLHGLMFPKALQVADTANQGVPTASEWKVDSPFTGGVAPTSAFEMASAYDGTGRIHIAFVKNNPTSGFNELWYAFRDSGEASIWEVELTGVTAGGVGSTIPGDFVDIAVTFSGVPHICFHKGPATGAPGLGYVFRDNSDGTWISEEIDATANNNGQHCSIALDRSEKPHVVFQDATANTLFYSNRSSGSWETPVAIDATVANEGWYADIAIDVEGTIHVCHFDETNDNLRYLQRPGGSAWVNKELVFGTGDVGRFCGIAVDPDDNTPAIIFSDVTNTDVKFVRRTGGTWATPVTIDTAAALAGTQATMIYQSSSVIHIAYQKVGASGDYGRSIDGGSNWTTAVVNAISLAQSIAFDSVVGKVRYTHAATSLTIGANDYHYKLTAEYDDGNLGESGPSGETLVFIDKPIDTDDTHVLDLTHVGFTSGRYNMSREVTKLFIYRTIAGGSADSTFYEVGEVAVTDGTVATDFTDDVPDSDLVANRILDDDKFLPPKYKTAVYWKDRLVIGNTKGRALNQAEAVALDVEKGGIHKNRLRFSEAFLPDVFRRNFFQDIEDDLGDILNLVVDRATDTLLVFCENGAVGLRGSISPGSDLFTTLSFNPVDLDCPGLAARKSLVNHEGRTFYVTNRGVEVLEGSRSRNISDDTVAPLFRKDIPSTHPSFADRVQGGSINGTIGTFYSDGFGEKILFSYPAGDGSENRILVLDYTLWKKQGFAGDGIFSLYSGLFINAFVTFQGPSIENGELFGGESIGANHSFIYRLFFGNFDERGSAATTVTKSAISYNIHPGLTDAGTGNGLKKWQSTRVNGRVETSTGSTALTIKADIDDGGLLSTLDTVTWTEGANQREPRNFPRTAIGVYGGVQLGGADTLVAGDGPGPFELYDIGLTVQDLVTRHRG